MLSIHKIYLEWLQFIAHNKSLTAVQISHLNIKIMGWIGILCFVLSSALYLFPIISMLLSVCWCIIMLVLYKKLDKICHVRLLRLNLYQYFITLTVVCILLLLATTQLMQFVLLSANIELYIKCTVIMVGLVLLAVNNYQFAQNMFIVSNVCQNKYYKWSAIFTKYGTYTLFILIGFILIAVAQILFLVGCIKFRLPIIPTSPLLQNLMRNTND